MKITKPLLALSVSLIISGCAFNRDIDDGVTAITLYDPFAPSFHIVKIDTNKTAGYQYQTISGKSILDQTADAAATAYGYRQIGQGLRRIQPDSELNNINGGSNVNQNYNFNANQNNSK